MARMTLAAARKQIADYRTFNGSDSSNISDALDFLLVEAEAAASLRKGPIIDDDTGLESVTRMAKDLVGISSKLSAHEARFLVGYYYQMQEHRKRSANQALALGETPHMVMDWLTRQNEMLELQIKKSLDVYSAAHPVGEWSRSLVGIGPVLAAGLLAYIDIEKAPTAGSIWRYAGYDPTVVWEKGQKRPWNARLKVLGWKCGQSFMKASGKEDCFYGQLYRARKDYEIARNDSGGNAETAKLWVNRVGRETQARAHYEAGHLPPSQIDARARRWAVKIFMAHWHDVMFEYHYRKAPPAPYPIVHLGHTHVIEIPNKPKFF